MRFNYVRLLEARDALQEAEEEYRAQVMRAREAGESWAAIARLLGVSKQGLHKRFGPRPSTAGTSAAGGTQTDPLFP